MPFYMFQGRYNSGAIKSMIERPDDREAAVRKMIEALGGKLHHFFFSFGTEDVVAIVEAPDDTTIAAGSMLVGGSGAMSSGFTTRLLTSAEAMDAMKKAGESTAAYRPAGS